MKSLTFETLKSYYIRKAMQRFGSKVRLVNQTSDSQVKRK